MLLVTITLLGLLVGSFLNVVVHRVPRGESLLRPGSRCPGCGRPVRARHNVPVLGWLVLRGRCADCGRPISLRYPLVEAATGALFLLVTARLARLELLGALPAYLYLTAAGVALALVDVEWHRLPNAIVLPSYPVMAALLALAAWWQGGWWPLARAGLGAAALFVCYLTLALAYPAGMQFGDVKLAGVLGGALGFLSWPALVFGAFGAFLSGGLFGVALIATGRGGRKTALPFGPFMIASALLALLLPLPHPFPT